jgi:hypothetical protein
MIRVAYVHCTLNGKASWLKLLQLRHILLEGSLLAGAGLHLYQQRESATQMLACY